MRQFSVALIAAALGLGAAGAAHAAPATYKIDDDHTYATFAIDHFGASVNRARFDTVTGTVQFDKAAKAGKIDVTVDVTEWLGNEQYAYIPYDTDPSVQDKLDELDRELDGEGMRTQLIVNLDARSRVREGDQAELVFDPALMHVFDPESGICLTRNEEAAQQIAKDSEEDRRRALERAKERDAREDERAQARAKG